MTSKMTAALLALTLTACSNDPASNNDKGSNDTNDMAATPDSGTNNPTRDAGNNTTPDAGNNTPGDMNQPGDMAGGDMGADMDGPVDMGPPPDPLDGIGDVELVQEGFQFTEGPRWYPDENVLRFTDIPANTIYELVEPDTIIEFTTNSGGANGLAFDANGNVLAAEHGGRRVSMYVGGNAMDLVPDYNGDAFNSPNDLIVRSDGTIYFTDPPYGLGNRQREINFNGLFRYDPADQSVTAEWEGGMNTRPNGVVLSPDESVLYLADTQGSSVTAFDVAADGSLSGERDFADAQNPDGMAVDVWGNLYVTAGDGVNVFAPDGTQWGNIDVPRQPANCAFGGADGKTLYITARSALYRVTLQVEGIY